MVKLARCLEVHYNPLQTNFDLKKENYGLLQSNVGLWTKLVSVLKQKVQSPIHCNMLLFVIKGMCYWKEIQIFAKFEDTGSNLSICEKWISSFFSSKFFIVIYIIRKARKCVFIKYIYVYFIFLYLVSLKNNWERMSVRFYFWPAGRGQTLTIRIHRCPL